MSIFIQITSYRDPELINTIKDCISKAKNPDKLKFGIVSQRDENDDCDLTEFSDDPRFKIVETHWTDSEGSGWARNIAQKLYNKEDYTLQIDSHHRFEKNWDETLIEMIKSVNSDKPLLSSYANAYRPTNNEKFGLEPAKIVTGGFTESSNLILRSTIIEKWEKLKGPIPARFACGHFIFTIGKFCEEFEYDPEIYFEEIDINITLRSFTLGYDLFHPNKNVIWHNYSREGHRKHWLDHTQELKDKNLISKLWWERDELSVERTKKLLYNEGDVELKNYGLGKERSYEEYVKYSGIDFVNRRIQKSTLKGENPPCKYENEEKWEEGFDNNTNKEHQEYNIIVSWDKEEIEFAEDYEFWFFGFHNEEGKEIYRKDFTKQQNEKILNLEENSTNVVFRSETAPKKCIIWPFSKSKGWLKKIEKEF